MSSQRARLVAFLQTNASLDVINDITTRVYVKPHDLSNDRNQYGFSICYQSQFCYADCEIALLMNDELYYSDEWGYENVCQFTFDEVRDEITRLINLMQR